MTEIRLVGLSKHYGGQGAPGSLVRAVDDVNLTIASGEFFFLLGPSGCGKTTLLRMIAGLIEPTAGHVLFGDRDVTDLPVEDRRTAMVFQNYALWPHMTVRQNVEFGPKMRGLRRADRGEIARQSLRRVQMEDLASRKPNQLSGGQQQRVALARALAARPDALLLDEPLSNLDARLRLHMRSELRGLVKSSGTTAVYVTHDQKEALSMADRIAVMDSGRIVQVGAPEQLYRRPVARFVADFLGEGNFLDGEVRDVAAAGTVETPLGRLRADTSAFAPGRRVTCCVRPECVLLIAQDQPVPPGHEDLPGVIESATFLGELRQYAVSLSPRVRWKVTGLTGQIPALPAGANVRVCVRADDVSVLPPDEV